MLLKIVPLNLFDLTPILSVSLVWKVAMVVLQLQKSVTSNMNIGDFAILPTTSRAWRSGGISIPSARRLGS